MLLHGVIALDTRSGSIFALTLTVSLALQADIVTKHGTQYKVFLDYKIFPDTISKGKLLTHLEAMGLACGIRTPLTYHVARHSFGTLTLEAGVPIESIAKMMGHSSIASTQIYAQITDQKISRDMDRIL